MPPRISNGFAPVALLALAGLSTPAAAEVPQGFDLSFQIYSHKYQEQVGGAFFMSNEGPFGGVGVDYTKKLEGDIYFRGSTSLAYGSVDYTGSGTIGGTPNYTLILEGRLGREFAVTDAFSVAPWAGLGYRMHYDDKGGEITSTGFFGYDRKSQYIYLPFAVTLDYRANSEWSLTPEFAYRLLLKGTQTSYMSDFSPACTDLENSQKSGYGLSAALNARTTIGQTPVTFGPFIRYWDIAESDIGIFSCGGTLFAGVEPDNTTTEIGIAVSLHY